MQNPDDASLYIDHLSLKDLTLCSDIQQPSERQPSCSGGDCRSDMNSSSSDFLSSPCSSSFNGDYIGMESCFDVLKNDEDGDQQRLLDINGGDDDDDDLITIHRRRRLIRKRDERLSWKKKEFPPPIPLLARTENLPSHMPWVLKRHYTSDGRLILTEEKVKHHEYFRAHRSNGRLTLQLVPLDDGDLDEEETAAETEINETDSVDDLTVEINKDIDEKEYDFMEVEEAKKGNNDIGGKYGIKYNSSVSVRSGSPCIFGVPVPVPVPAIRPVHT